MRQLSKFLPIDGEGDRQRSGRWRGVSADTVLADWPLHRALHGPPPRKRGGTEAGFTLIELMVALFIFAILSAAGVMLLSGSVGAQGVVQQRLDQLADVQRAASLMTVDFAQAVPRISRTRTGTLAPAFFAAGAERPDPAIQFIRTGRDNPDGLERSGLQKLEYGLVDGRLIRRAYPQVDGAEPERAAVLLDGVQGVALRFRGPDGGWRGDWRDADPLAMPRAVELTVARRDGQPIRLLFLVGVDPVPKKAEQPGG